MKKTILLLCSSLLILASNITDMSAQKTKIKKPVFKTAIFGQLGTTSMGLGFGFDMRLQRGKRNGIGVEAALSCAPAPDNLTVVSFPVGLNYLFGKRAHFFEMGLSTTPILFLTNREKQNNVNPSFNLTLSPRIGWRYQNPNEGLFVSICVAPLVVLYSAGGELNNFPIGADIKMGYTF